MTRRVTERLGLAAGDAQDQRDVDLLVRKGAVVTPQPVLAEVEADTNPGARTIAKWRRAWRTIDKRDYFDAPLRERTRASIQDRADALASSAERQEATS